MPQSNGSQTVMCTRITWDLVKLQLPTGDTCVEADSAFLVSSQVTLQVQDHVSVARLLADGFPQPFLLTQQGQVGWSLPHLIHDDTTSSKSPQRPGTSRLGGLGPNYKVRLGLIPLSHPEGRLDRGSSCRPPPRVLHTAQGQHPGLSEHTDHQLYSKTDNDLVLLTAPAGNLSSG